MLEDCQAQSAEDIDRLLCTALYEPPTRADVKARGAASLAALATEETARRPGLPRLLPAAGRARRSWRAAAAAVVAAAASAAALAVMIIGTPGARQSSAALDAFTVTRHGKAVDVTVRELESYWSARTRAALKRKLRAAGVPAIIWSHGGQIYAAAAKPPASVHPTLWCHPSPLVAKVFTDVARSGPAFAHAVAMNIQPGNIPPGARVLLVIFTGRSVHGVHPVAFTLPGFLLTASGRCLSVR
ncbi:MAG: hypothetical protein ACRDRJ_31815 [Streptosporangiaceae bacterium]